MGGGLQGARRPTAARAVPLLRGLCQPPEEPSVPSRIPENPGAASAQPKSPAKVAPIRGGGEPHLHEEILALPAPWVLHYGDELPDAHIAFRLIGPAQSPLVAVLGGISAHRIVSGE